MPSLIEEDSSSAFMPSQVMGTLPEYQPDHQHRESAGQVFFFVPDPIDDQHHPPLLPAARVSDELTEGYAVQAPTFSSQSSFEQAANTYLVDGSSSWQPSQPRQGQFVMHPQMIQPGYEVQQYATSEDPDGPRPLTAPESNSGDYLSAPPPTSMSMRK
jgi:hypothetical protein